MSYLGGWCLRISHPMLEFLFVLSSGLTPTIPHAWTLIFSQSSSWRWGPPLHARRAVSFQRLISTQSLLSLKLDGDRRAGFTRLFIQTRGTLTLLYHSQVRVMVMEQIWLLLLFCYLFFLASFYKDDSEVGGSGCKIDIQLQRRDEIVLGLHPFGHFNLECAGQSRHWVEGGQLYTLSKHTKVYMLSCFIIGTL